MGIAFLRWMVRCHRAIWFPATAPDKILPRLLGKRFEGSLDLDAAGSTNDIERADGEWLTWKDYGASFKGGLTDDGVLREGVGAIFNDAGLLDLGPETESAGSIVDYRVEVHSNIEIGDLTLGVLGIRSREDRDTITLLEDSALPSDKNHRVVLVAETLCAVKIDKSIGETVTPFRLIKLEDKFLSCRDILCWGLHDDSVLRRDEGDAIAWIVHIAQGRENFAGFLLRRQILEIEDMGDGGTIGWMLWHLLFGWRRRWLRGLSVGVEGDGCSESEAGDEAQVGSCGYHSLSPILMSGGSKNA